MNLNNFKKGQTSKAGTKYASNFHSIDSMSQASSTRPKQGGAKVIYNKFFKEKGFLPPLMA